MTGNCVRLEGTGDLNHYSCVDRFTSGCPTEPYQDDKIFKCKILFSFKFLNFPWKHNFNTFLKEDEFLFLYLLHLIMKKFKTEHFLFQEMNVDYF